MLLVRCCCLCFVCIVLAGCMGFDWKNGPHFPGDGDGDGDGIADADDHCPNDSEDFDQFEDEDGCPDPDNDRDGVLDVHDYCPNEPEDIDGDTDEDGCPDNRAMIAQ